MEHLFSWAGKERPEGDPFSFKEKYPDSAAPLSLLGFLPGGGRGKSRAPGCPPVLHLPIPGFPCRFPFHPWGFSPFEEVVKPSAMLRSFGWVLKAPNRLGNAAGLRRAGCEGLPSHWLGPRVGGEFTPLTPPSL